MECGIEVRLALLATLASIAATSSAEIVDTQSCNGGQSCVTAIRGMDFQGLRYDITFNYAPFYDVYPDPSEYPFWGKDADAYAMAVAIREVLVAHNLQGIAGDAGDTNGFTVPFAYINEWVLWAKGAAYGGVPPEWSPVWSSSASTAGGYFAVFSPSNTLATPLAEVTPRSADFGSVVVSGSETTVFTVNNVGTAPLSVTRIAQADALAAPFFVANDLCAGATIQSGANCSFSVRFAPLAMGEYSDSFSVETNDPYSPSIRVTINGKAVTVGGQAVGLGKLTVTCENKTRKTSLTFPLSSVEQGSWDCQAAGLPVTAGDEITMKVKGIAK